jgi:hypothetical protein
MTNLQIIKTLSSNDIFKENKEESEHIQEFLHENMTERKSKNNFKTF